MNGLLARRFIALALLTVTMVFAPARAAMLAAGSANGAWIITDAAIGGVTLIFIDPLRPGVGLTVARFGSAPVALSAGPDCVIAAFGAETIAGASIRPMRITSIEPGPNGLQLFTRPRALPPLPSGAPLGGVAIEGRTIVALTIAPQVLWVCDDTGWKQASLPAGAAEWASMWVVDYLGRIGLCGVDDAGRGALWTTDVSASPDAWVWTRSDIAIPRDAHTLIRVSSHLVAESSTPDGAELILSLLRPEDSIERARIKTGPAAPVIAPLGDRVVIASPGTTDPLRIDVRVVGLDGHSAFDGPLTSASPLAAEDVQLVVLGVMAVVLAAMMFALRGDNQGVVKMPDNAVLAPPRRRAWATLIDLIPGIAVGWLVGSWQLAAGEYADPVITGIAAGFLASLIPAVIGEALTGRTIGKAFLGLRTIKADGGKPTWPQALGRNLSKLLYPPLGLLILMNPAATTPGSCGTIVIMNRPPSGTLDPTPPGPDR